MRKVSAHDQTSQDGGDTSSITSGIENEVKKAVTGLVKIKRSSIKKKVQSFSHESDDGVIEPLLQKDKEKLQEFPTQSAKYLLSKTKTEVPDERANDRDKLLSDHIYEKLPLTSYMDIQSNGARETYKPFICSANAMHNHMNTNVFSTSDGKKNTPSTRTQVLVEIDGNKPTFSSGPLIFTTAKIHTDGKNMQMEPVQVTPVPILSTVEGNVVKTTSVCESERKNMGVLYKGDTTVRNDFPKAEGDITRDGSSNKLITAETHSKFEPLLSKKSIAGITELKASIATTTVKTKANEKVNNVTQTVPPKLDTNTFIKLTQTEKCEPKVNADERRTNAIEELRETDVNKSFQTISTPSNNTSLTSSNRHAQYLENIEQSKHSQLKEVVIGGIDDAESSTSKPLGIHYNDTTKGSSTLGKPNAVTTNEKQSKPIGAINVSISKIGVIEEKPTLTTAVTLTSKSSTESKKTTASSIPNSSATPCKSSTAFDSKVNSSVSLKKETPKNQAIKITGTITSPTLSSISTCVGTPVLSTNSNVVTSDKISAIPKSLALSKSSNMSATRNPLTSSAEPITCTANSTVKNTEIYPTVGKPVTTSSRIIFTNSISTTATNNSSAVSPVLTTSNTTMSVGKPPSIKPTTITSKSSTAVSCSIITTSGNQSASKPIPVTASPKSSTSIKSSVTTPRCNVPTPGKQLTSTSKPVTSTTTTTSATGKSSVTTTARPSPSAASSMPRTQSSSVKTVTTPSSGAKNIKSATGTGVSTFSSGTPANSSSANIINNKINTAKGSFTTESKATNSVTPGSTETTVTVAPSSQAATTLAKSISTPAKVVNAGTKSGSSGGSSKVPQALVPSKSQSNTNPINSTKVDSKHATSSISTSNQVNKPSSAVNKPNELQSNDHKKEKLNNK